MFQQSESYDVLFNDILFCFVFKKAVILYYQMVKTWQSNTK